MFSLPKQPPFVGLGSVSVQGNTSLLDIGERHPICSSELTPASSATLQQHFGKHERTQANFGLGAGDLQEMFPSPGNQSWEVYRASEQSLGSASSPQQLPRSTHSLAASRWG